MNQKYCICIHIIIFKFDFQRFRVVYIINRESEPKDTMGINFPYCFQKFLGHLLLTGLITKIRKILAFCLAIKKISLGQLHKTY